MLSTHTPSRTHSRLVLSTLCAKHFLLATNSPSSPYPFSPSSETVPPGGVYALDHMEDNPEYYLNQYTAEEIERIKAQREAEWEAGDSIGDQVCVLCSLLYASECASRVICVCARMWNPHEWKEWDVRISV